MQKYILQYSFFNGDNTVIKQWKFESKDDDSAIKVAGREWKKISRKIFNPQFEALVRPIDWSPKS